MSKKDIVKYIIDVYGVTSPTDITNALKDLLGETLQDMLNSEFDEYMGYDKYDQKTDKTNFDLVPVKWTHKINKIDDSSINLCPRSEARGNGENYEKDFSSIYYIYG